MKLRRIVFREKLILGILNLQRRVLSLITLNFFLFPQPFIVTFLHKHVLCIEILFNCNNLAGSCGGSRYVPILRFNYYYNYCCRLSFIRILYLQQLGRLFNIIVLRRDIFGICQKYHELQLRGL